MFVNVHILVFQINMSVGISMHVVRKYCSFFIGEKCILVGKFLNLLKQIAFKVSQSKHSHQKIAHRSKMALIRIGRFRTVQTIVSAVLDQSATVESKLGSRFK